MLTLIPMALFLRVSLSYDVMKTALSFLLIALMLKFAFTGKTSLTSRNIVLLITVVVLLALSKVPYFIFGLMFLLIPVNKTGSLKKYLLLFLSIMVIPGIAIKLFSLAAAYFGPKNAVLTEQPYGMPTSMMPSNIDDQISHVIGNIPGFITVLFKTVFVYRGDYYLSEFVGNLGWLDTPLPSFFVVLFLAMLIIAAIGDSTFGINPGWKWKAIPLIGFIMAVAVIETVYYIYASPYKGIAVEGVQGRYFIPYSPLFFLLFYNRYLTEKLNVAFSLRKDELTRLKSKEKAELLIYIQKDEQIFSKTLHLLIVCFIVFSLSFTVYTLAHRYYYIGETIESVEARKKAENEAKLNLAKIQENQQAENRYFDLARVAFTSGKLDSAAVYLEKVIGLNEKNSEAANNLAMLYIQLNQKDKAIRVVEKMKAKGIEVNKNLLDLTK
jgi:uncharacterized membrane protein